MALLYDRVDENKRKTFFLFAGFFIVVLALGWVLGELFAYGFIGIGVAFILAMVGAVFSYYYSDKMVLAISGARPVEKKQFPFLVNTVEGLSIAAGIPAPKLYYIADSAPNAFATGRDPKHSVICVTTGLLDKMDRQELEGVISHEMSHIKNRDILVMTVTVVLVGVVALVSDMILRSFFWGGHRSDARGRGNMVLLVIALLLAVLAPIIATLMKLAVSRKREFLADADGALLTRNPEGLARALEKMDRDKEPLEAANAATAHLYIANPLKNHHGWFDGLFSTHPPLAERVKVLRERA